MHQVKLELDKDNKGNFFLMEGEVKTGEMAVSISGNELTAYHTEVDPAAQGKGLAKILLNAMVEHASNNDLKVVPHCPYVHAQFKRHPEEFEDVWLKK